MLVGYVGREPQPDLGPDHGRVNWTRAVTIPNTGATDVGFQASPAGADDPAALAAATAGNSLKDVGMVFNQFNLTALVFISAYCYADRARSEQHVQADAFPQTH